MVKVVGAKVVVIYCMVEQATTLQPSDAFNIHPNFSSMHETGHEFMGLDIIDPKIGIESSFSFQHL